MPRKTDKPERGGGSGKTLPVIGWREWITLPELQIDKIKAKIDTGARSSALHAFDLEIFRRGGIERVRFKVHPYQRDTSRTVTAESRVVEHRVVRSSSGHESLRPVILTHVELMGQLWPIEVTLTNRDAMGFRMLLSRRAVGKRFLVDPGRSFLGGKQGPVMKRRKRTPKQRKKPRKRGKKR